MDASKSFFKTITGYFKKDKDVPAAAAQPEGEGAEQQAKSLDNLKQGRVKPSGGGLNKKYVIGAFFIVAILAMYSIMLGAGREGGHINKGDEKQNQTVTVGNGNHLRNVPGDYTEEGKMEQEKKPAAAAKEEKAPVKQKAVQPRPTLPRQPVRQEKPRMTLEQQERMEEYEAMKKAYQSPIKFELKE